MVLDRPVHAAEAADGTTVGAPLASGCAAYGGLAQNAPPPRFLASAGRGYVMTTSQRLSPLPLLLIALLAPSDVLL